MKQSFRIIIFTNGTLDPSFISELNTTDYIIGVDKAAYWLIQHRIVPNLAIGDFDSTNQGELLLIKQACKTVLSFSPKKDFTDTELALQKAIELNPSEIILFGATGTRIDHTLANIHLLETLLDQHIPSCIRDSHNEIRLIEAEYTIKENDRYKYISVLSVSDEIELSLSGFAYDVDHAKIQRDQSLGISNEITGKKATIIIYAGKALVIQSKD